MAERIQGARIELSPRKKAFIDGVTRLFAWRLQIEGSEVFGEVRELLNQDAPVEIFPNHLSHADGAMLNTVLKKEASDIEEKLVFIVGTVILKNHLTRFLLPYRGIAIPSQRRKPATPQEWEERKLQVDSAFEAAGDALRGGEVVVNFAEGSRSRERKMVQADEKIVQYFYLVPNIHIVPVGIWGTEKLLPPDTRIIIPRPWAKVSMKFGKPISVDELEDRVGESPTKHENDQRLVDEVMREVAN